MSGDLTWLCLYMHRVPFTEDDNHRVIFTLYDRITHSFRLIIWKADCLTTSSFLKLTADKSKDWWSTRDGQLAPILHKRLTNSKNFAEIRQQTMTIL